MNTNDTAITIAKINDEFRRSMIGCTVTSGVVALTHLMNDIFIAVRDYSDFNPGNDPHGEHDFGSFQIAGIKFCWKIDYYDQEFESWCDPLSNECRRHLTIMRAEEY